MPSDPEVSSLPARGSAGIPWGKLAPLIIFAALTALVIGMGWHRELSLESIVRRRAELERVVAGNLLAALLGYMSLYVAVVAMSVPGAVFLTIAGGILFGWLVGGLAAVVGATVGATLLFLIARNALADFVRRRLGPRLNAIAEGFRADAFSYLLFLRLVPVFPFFLVNLAPALAGIGVGTFVAATFIGILPGTFAFATFGAGLDSVIAAQEAAYKACLAAGRAGCRLNFDVKAALTPQLLAALTALGIAALIPVVVKRWRARAPRPSTS
jgi:uncharacterized membrane protein YdjX (TVP38/TMEM64 family)